ncbi:8-oxo-dGTP diphosphatase [Arthrobacter sp. ISL-48]|uniref:8-oxo-dGTP diphosphatase n=1 Tax=Arthrobacter sp. ISL-48 TaxID=2819110 RepID=UPI001BE583C2|nr:8-oxo-dGTP diphosphatase [Arthrobacter sp. ISL-48]MBT2532881.1 8-oxo-dGTP diphosphatase [Arthrobacter sp. ISL-48]
MSAADVTLCFLLRDGDAGREVLLGLKKTGFGLGKVVAVGGHVEPGETPLEAICREVHEEVSVHVAPADLVLAGTVHFVFPARPQWDMFTTVYLAESWRGEPVESNEIVPRWYMVDRLPVEHMWADAEHWVPAMIGGRKLAVKVILEDDNEGVARVHSVDWKEAG